jgi:hypothetical protein
MQAWLRQYGSDSGSSAAQAALAKLRAEHWNEMRSLLQKYGAGSATSGSGPATGGPGSGYRGMMGGGYGGGYGGGMMNSY